MKPSNSVDKYTVSINKDDLIAGHLKLDKNRKFSKKTFCFLQTGRYATCEVVTTGQ